MIGQDLPVGLLSVDEASEKYGLRPATIVVLYNMHVLDGAVIGDEIYILSNSESPENMR